MRGIGGDVGHGGNHGGENDVPVLGGVFVQSGLNALEDVDLLGQRVERCLEAQGSLAAELVAALEFEHYNVLDHWFLVFCC